MTTDWFGVDWGSTHLRVWRFDASGRVLASYNSACGAATLSPDAFEAALLDLIGKDVPAEGRTSVFCCGMAGARQGWRSAGYMSVPADPIPSPGDLTSFEAMGGRLVIHLLPGVAQTRWPDVMRGEETQIAGVLAGRPDFEGALCLPGTHSKWALLGHEKITRFQTYPTGELFHLLSHRSVLRHSVGEAGFDDDVFAEGVRTSLDRPADFLGQLFPIRARDLLQNARGVAARSTLSGLLIGLELANAHEFWSGRQVIVVGAADLARLYHAALGLVGAKAGVEDGEAIVRAGLVAARSRIEGT